MQISPSPLPFATVKPLPLTAVRLEDGFWHSRARVVQEASLMHGYRMLEESGTVNNIRIAANRAQGEFRGYVFQDSDLYKWLEAAALSLGQTLNAELESQVTSLIALLSAAQFPDGYLNSHFSSTKPGQRWTDLEWAHELYCAGHLIEAGIAHKRATGKTDLFEIALRFADHIDATFGEDEGKRAGLCGHPEIELALVELYRETTGPRYLRLAQYFIDRRGHDTFQGLRHIGPLYMQDHVPVRDAQTAQGHAVRQLYLCAGATDLYLETGERVLLDAMERLWQDMTRGKMYLTGGVGARGYGEMFGEAYELPTREAYCETCAAIAAMMWNWRMLLATNETRYADALERVLYNGFLSGIALDGTHFFYENPLRSDGSYARQEWFGCACCPPNVMRQMMLVGSYCATENDRGVQIHQYMNARVKSKFGEWRIETNYPWDGTVRVTCESEGESELALRIPGWCGSAELNIEHKKTSAAGGEYAKVRRVWRRGDSVELLMPLAPRFVRAHPYVDGTRGCVAIERGPLVYCIEAQDQRADVNDLTVNSTAELEARWDGTLCGGAVTIRVAGGVENTRAWNDDLYRAAENSRTGGEGTEITAVPYYLWGNRSPGKMRVWIPGMD